VTHLRHQHDRGHGALPSHGTHPTVGSNPHQRRAAAAGGATAWGATGPDPPAPGCASRPGWRDGVGQSRSECAASRPPVLGPAR
jgi:hypothetical protein